MSLDAAIAKIVSSVADLECLCGHRKSLHDFDDLTPAGFCQEGNYRTGCDCMIYEPRGLRPADPDRHHNGIPK